MSTRIAPGSSIKREIYIADIEKPVQMEITSFGITFWMKGSRKRVETRWLTIVSNGTTGQDVPSFLAGRPLELLKHYAERG
jgi:hypothetical protein